MPADPTPHGATAAGRRRRAGSRLPPGPDRAASAAATRPSGWPRSRCATCPWEVGVAKPDPAIVVDGVTRTFGGLTAVSVDHLEIQRGGITGLIGPNGAGKTTLFNLLTGFDQPDTGTWSFDGQSLGKLSPHQVARLGVVRTFQLTKALSRLTVLQNMLLGAQGQRGESFLRALLPGIWRAQEKANTEKAMDLLQRFKLDAKKDDFAGTLSGGQRKLLEMARALMSDPQVVMLDEPMAGVNPALTQSLLGPRQGPARAGHDGDLRRARHGRRPRHQRLGGRHGRRPDHRRGPAGVDQPEPGRRRRLPGRPPRRAAHRRGGGPRPRRGRAGDRPRGAAEGDVLSSDAPAGGEDRPMSDPLFEVDESGEDVTRADTRRDHDRALPRREGGDPRGARAPRRGRAGPRRRPGRRLRARA